MAHWAKPMETKANPLRAKGSSRKLNMVSGKMQARTLGHTFSTLAERANTR